jgi:hypothetical protein
MSSQSSFGHCKGCQAPIRFARHKGTERTNAFELGPHENALLDRQTGLYEFLTGEDLERARAQRIPLYICHAALCSNPPLRHGGAARRLSRRRREVRA